MAKINYGLIGYPLGHTMSPFIHQRLFELEGIDGQYDKFEIHPDKLKSKFDELKKLRGFNVTIPHKIGIIPYLDELSDKAKLYSAVNTVEVGEKMIGHNTDCIGFINALKSRNIPLSGDVLICGVGGVSHMFAFEVALAGVKSITLASLASDEKIGSKLADDIKTKYSIDTKFVPIDKVSGEYNLIINGTPVGMRGVSDDMPVGKSIVDRTQFVFDAIYNPRETALIKTAKANGATVSGGMPMLVWQAVVAQEIWHKFKFDNDDINQIIDDSYAEMHKLFGE